MIQFAVACLLVILPLWAPWMDTRTSGELAEQVFEAFGPTPSACYSSEDVKLQDGIEVRWYPMGRLIHTCSGDFIIWFWGGVKEAGGIYKKPEEIRAIQSRPLTCTEVLERQDVRRASSTVRDVPYFEGMPAPEPDFSIFPDAKEYETVIRTALSAGPNFAGKFTVAEWSCGTACQNHAIIDVETGLVISVGPITEYGISYSRESTLLITNPKESLPELPATRYETESVALGIARVPREYFRLTTDELSRTQYLVRECVESSATGYIEIEDDRLGVIQDIQEE